MNKNFILLLFLIYLAFNKPKKTNKKCKEGKKNVLIKTSVIITYAAYQAYSAASLDIQNAFIIIVLLELFSFRV